MRKLLFLALTALVAACPSAKAVTLPYEFSTGTIRASEINADFAALRDAFNTHAASRTTHGTRLQDALSQDNSCGAYSIDFNGTQALTFRVENVSADPSCAAGSKGRLIWNTVDGLFKICDGSSFVSIAGSGVNTLQSVLSAGNSAGAYNINLNGNQLIGFRVENVSADPTAGTVGRLIFNTSDSTLKLDNGSSIVSVGGAQGLSSVLGVSNSTGSTNINFNGTQGINFRLENLSSDPGTASAGRAYYNTSSGQPRFYNGSSWSVIGNTNTLAQTLALGNSVGSYNLDLNGKQLLNAYLQSLSAAPGTGMAGRAWYNSTLESVQFGTSASYKTVATLTGTETLTGKTISGASNTISNVPDSALSANVALLDTAQTVSAKKTFTAAPQISLIKTAAGTTNGHVIPDVADDTFTLNNATQELRGKTLNAPTLSGNLDFAEYQAVRMRAENLSSSPSAGHAGRIIYKTTTGELLYDNGSTWLVLGTATSIYPTLAQVLGTGNSAGITNLDMNDQQILNVRVENLGALPAAGNVGRIVYYTVDGRLYWDNGTTWSVMGNPIGTASRAAYFNGSGDLAASAVTSTELGYVGGVTSSLCGINQSCTVTNKTIDAASNTLSNISNTEIKAGAAIAVNKLAALTASKLPVLDASGFLSASAVTSTEAGYLSGVTSAIQTQLNGKQASLGYTPEDSANKSIDGTFALNSDTLYPSQKAAKTYADTKVSGTSSSVDKEIMLFSGTGGKTAARATGTGYVKVTSGVMGTPSATVPLSDLATGTAYRLLVRDSGGAATDNAAITASRALVSDANGVPSASSVTSTELGYVSGVTSSIQTQINTISAANSFKAPTTQTFTSGSGTYNKTYAFTISSGNATVGATYTHNSVTYTVYATVASSTLVYMSGSAAPLSSGTLTKATGTGDATLTFSAYQAPSYIRVKLVGGGGGGGGGGTAGSAGGTGGNTTFGVSCLTANGGTGGNTGNNAAVAAGGTASIGSCGVGQALQGGSGSEGMVSSVSGAYAIGGHGASTPFGGAGGGGSASTAGGAGITNSGSGGGGGGSNNPSGTTFGGNGGGAGGYVDAIISSPSATYAYSIGGAGTSGAAGGSPSGQAGGAGGSGFIIVTEYFQ